MSSWWDWWNSLLTYLGFVGKTGNILFLGLDFAGKTSLLGMLKNGQMSQYNPTQHGTSEEIKLGGITFLAQDLGGHKQARRVWHKYYAAVDGIVFLLDVTDRERFREALGELQGIMADEQIHDCPILILANKIDAHGAASEEEIRHVFNLYGKTTGKEKIDRSHLTSRPCELFMCSIKKKQGYGNGLRWLAHYI